MEHTVFELTILFSEYMYFIVGKSVCEYMKICLDIISLFSRYFLTKFTAKKRKMMIRIMERP